mgnify:CR=1 FL=1
MELPVDPAELLDRLRAQVGDAPDLGAGLVGGALGIIYMLFTVFAPRGGEAVPWEHNIQTAFVLAPFGAVFSDHMLVVDWHNGKWGEPRIVPYGAQPLPAAPSVAHYGQGIFEGFKAFPRPNGGAVLFRPDANHARMNRTCQRMAMPEIPASIFVDGSAALVALDRNRVVGFTMTAPAGDPDCDPVADAEVMEFTVAAADRGRGHGSRLLQAAADTLYAHFARKFDTLFQGVKTLPLDSVRTKPGYATAAESADSTRTLNAQAAGMTDQVIQAIDEIAGLVGNDIRRRLSPLAESRWARDPWVRGSYSHALPGRAGARAVLAAPVDGRLFFAGEATSPQFFSTAHGARDSGERAANEAMASRRTTLVTATADTSHPPE